MGVDKFIQPVSGIHMVSRARGPRIPFGHEELLAAASRVKGGERLEDVAAEMAIEAVALEESMKTFRALAWTEWLHPRHEAGTKEGGQFAPKNDQGELHQAMMQEVGQNPLDEHERLDLGLYQPLRVGAAELQDLKAANAKRIAAKMIEAHGEVLGQTVYGDQELTKALEFRAAAEIDMWSETSGDSKPQPVAMQHVAKEMFAPDAPVEHLRGQPDPPTLRDPGSKAYLEAEYTITQNFLKSKGIGQVTLFRGTQNNGSKLDDGETEVTMQPMSSWATTPRDSTGFLGGYSGAIMVAQVPASRVQSTAVTGRGCLEESEVIVRGGKMRVQVFLRLAGESKGDFAQRVGMWLSERPIIE
jgi:hypothetical protein